MRQLGARSEDLAQETFVAAWQKLGELREPGEAAGVALAAGIVRNPTANALRRERRRGGAVESLDLASEPASAEADPAAQAVTQEEAILRWRSLAGLSETYREPMVLFYRQGQSVAEVARALELSEEAVRQRLARGRSLLREELATVVETTLTRTQPTGAFTVAVLAALAAVTPPKAAAATLTGVATGQGAATAKGLFASLGKGALLGPAIGLSIGLLSSKAAASTARSPAERACILRYARRLILFLFCDEPGSWRWTLTQAGSAFPASPLGIVSGILAWVAVLVSHGHVG